MPESPQQPDAPNDPTDAQAKPNILSVIAGDIKLSHTIFALPFALLGVFISAGTPETIGVQGRFPTLGEFALILICMFFARTFAMLANRYVDRDIDAKNPRTQNRALPAGRITVAQMRLALAITALAFWACAGLFYFVNNNPWPGIVAPLVLLWLGAYGLIKRFSLLCHFFLGAALAISPLAAGLAIHPPALEQPTLYWLAGFVLLWVGGFDVIYAMQDIECDKRDGLHSIPSKLGENLALFIAKLAHVGAIIMLVLAERSTGLLEQFFTYGMFGVGFLLVFEHYLAARGKFSMAIFTLNGVISVVLGVLGIIDIVLALN